MRSIPSFIDSLAWMRDDPEGYLAFARHLSNQVAREQLGLRREPAHLTEKDLPYVPYNWKESDV